MKKQHLQLLASGLIWITLCLSITGCASETEHLREPKSAAPSQTQPSEGSVNESSLSEIRPVDETGQEPAPEIPEEAPDGTQPFSSVLPSPSTPGIAPLDPSEPMPDADDIPPIITKGDAVAAADAYWSQPGKRPEVPEGQYYLVGVVQEPSLEDMRYHMELLLYTKAGSQGELIDEIWIDGITGEVVHES